MTSLTNALEQLREERNRAQQEVVQLDKAIAAIQGLAGGQHSRANSRGKRIISAAGRRRIAEAQRARWAKVKGVKLTLVKTASPTRRTRTMSAAARRKIAAAQRARWAKFRQQRKSA
jgi:hypothetical protein